MITAVITTFQRPALLRRAIESVQKQTWKEVVIFVSDSASNDETEKMVRSMAKEDARIVYHRHPEIITSIQNYQFVIDWVKTPFFSILSDDDLLFSDFYEKAIASLTKYPRAQFFLGSTIDAYLDGRPISGDALAWPHQELFEPAEGVQWVIRSYFNWTGALFRTQVAQQARLDVELVPIDYDFILRLAAQYPFTFSAEPCALFTHHRGSFSNHCGLPLIWPSFSKIRKTLSVLRPVEEQRDLKRIFDRNYKRKFLQISIQCIGRDDQAQLNAIAQACQLEFPKSKFQFALTALFRIVKVPVFRTLFLKLFQAYRFVKKVRVQNYLKSHRTEIA